MTRGEIEEIAEEASAKALQKLFLTFGVNTEDPKEIIAFQDDLRHVRRWRLSTEAASQHAVKTIIGVLLTGALGWVGLMFWRHQ